MHPPDSTRPTPITPKMLKPLLECYVPIGVENAYVCQMNVVRGVISDDNRCPRLRLSTGVINGKKQIYFYLRSRLGDIPQEDTSR